MSAFWYGGVAWSNDALSDERDDSRLLMPVGMFFVVIGGWLLSLFHGISFLLTHPTTAQVKDVISVLERNF